MVAHKLSPTTASTAYIALWFKRCVIPSLLRECITIRVLYSAVQLVYGCPLGLLLAMVCRIQHGLRLLTEAFLSEPKPNPRVDLPYTYLMAWFIFHC